MATENLTQAKKNKADEFYTQLSDIEAELRHYREYFCGKVVLCNCDDPYESNFFKYFAMNFNFLGLRKLITISYQGSPIAGEQLSWPEAFPDMPQQSVSRMPYKVEITEVTDENADGATDLADVEYLLKNRRNIMTRLKGNGDFRSGECIKLLKQADIVVTNPPFSLFREYVAQLVEHKKSFVIIGSMNAVTYKEVFSLIADEKLWLGYGFRGGNAYFYVPDGESRKWADGVYDHQTRLVKFRNVCWFTNLDIAKRHERLTLHAKYDPEQYPTYANYDAIEVSRVADIPYDYDGEMGVPITYLDKHNPEQFEIIGSSRWLGRPMSEIAPKGTYVQGGIRFYLLDKTKNRDTISEQSRAEQSRAEQSRAEQSRAEQSRAEQSRAERYRCLYDRIVIKRII